MRKITGILLVLLLLAAELHITVAVHYCGGKEAGAIISLSGKMATCGMESDNADHQQAALAKKHCCENRISSLQISSNYFPAGILRSLTPVVSNPVDFQLPVSFRLLSAPVTEVLFPIRPPGSFQPVEVSQSYICVFRI
jgi:hypothetical protein